MFLNSVKLTFIMVLEENCFKKALDNSTQLAFLFFSKVWYQIRAGPCRHVGNHSNITLAGNLFNLAIKAYCFKCTTGSPSPSNSAGLCHLSNGPFLDSSPVYSSMS